MKKSSAIAVAALGLLLPGPAFGLSCMAPEMNETVIDAAVMIIEGTAGPERPLDSEESEAARKHGFGALGGKVGDLRVYSFTVTRGWKGATAGQSVDVLLNSYWGDHFADGQSYLVVSPQKIGDLFLSPLCGSTVGAEYAADNGFLTTLERLIGTD